MCVYSMVLKCKSGDIVQYMKIANNGDCVCLYAFKLLKW